MYRKGRFSVYVFLICIENVVLRAFNVFRTTSVGYKLSPTDRKFRIVQIERNIFKLSDEEKELELVSKIVELMSKFQESLEEGIRENCFTEEQCAAVLSSLPHSRKRLVARKDELEELISLKDGVLDS